MTTKAAEAIARSIVFAQADQWRNPTADLAGVDLEALAELIVEEIKDLKDAQIKI